MSVVLKNTCYVLLLLCFYSQSTYAAKSTRFKVIDFDFALACSNAPNLSDPQFPDANVMNKDTVKGGFIEGEYAGNPTIDALSENAVSTYFAFDFNTVPMANYTAMTGIDGGNHPPASFDLENLKADLSSLYLNWNNIEMHIGQADLDMVKSRNNRYTVDFRTLLVGAPFKGCTSRLKLVLKPKGPKAGKFIKNRGFL